MCYDTTYHNYLGNNNYSMKIQRISKFGVALLAIFSFVLPSTLFAATNPSLGTASVYGVLSSTFTANGGITGVTGDVGYTTLSGSGTISVIGSTHTPAPGQSGTDQNNALADLNAQSCTSLGTNVLLAGTYAPGCYSSTGTMDIALNTTIILSGAGTYIFRSGGAITTGANSIISLANGASSCDVFWTPNGATTLGANSTFVGTDIPVSQDITVGNLTNWIGRALTFGHIVTTNTATIDATCSTSPAINATGGGPLVISPLISVLKVPTPLSLPLGPGLVTYNYSVSNIGPVAMNNIKVVDDLCPDMNFISGDINNDSLLDLSEVWNYSCKSNLLKTTTNTVIAKGEANGLTAIDTASATVVVGVPIIPPLIHVVKTPSVFLLPSGGGAVTYRYTVTNPGTAPLSNVTITDDKCTGLPGRVFGHPGDINKNDLLESNETWSFTCQTNIVKTTTNTGTVVGSANGLIATDFALATVVVPPSLPKTGFSPEDNSSLWNTFLNLFGSLWMQNSR
jgi:uncharacterized repeat protein (TIGR01451 family)